MKSIQVQAQLIGDKFKTINVNAEMSAARVFPELIRHMKENGNNEEHAEYKILLAKQIVYSEETSLEELDFQPGDYLLLVSTATAAVKLGLIPQNRFDHQGWIISHQEALIGRMDEKKGVYPDVDVTPFSTDPLTVSRQLAYLRESEGLWTIQLHKDGHSGLFVDKKKLESGEQCELHDLSILAFGSNVSNPDFLLQVRLITD